ncbi:hypothetical protein AGMMS49975_26820 [Clostridia bacterium]|nr:hypothetical protein AGMMS49975_26820 [Clostridia bacterium]
MKGESGGNWEENGGREVGELVGEGKYCTTLGGKIGDLVV